MPCSGADWEQVTTAERTRQTVDEARRCLESGDRRGYDARKRSLPMMLFMCTIEPNRGLKGDKPEACWRLQQAARLNGLVMLDADHVEDPRAVFGRIAPHWFDERSCPTPIFLVHVTPSGRGLRVVFGADAQRGNLADNQRYMASVLGVEPDEACTDASRGSFAPKSEDILYINPHIFDYDNPEYDKKFGDYYRRNGGAGGAAAGKTGADGTADGAAAAAAADGTGGGEADGEVEHEEMTYHGTAYQHIVDCWLDQNGSPAVGDRHQQLLKLAGDLRYITECNPRRLRPVLRLAPFVRDMEREGDAAEIDRVVASACERPCYHKHPKRLEACLGACGVHIGQGDGQEADAETYDSAGRTFWRRLEAHIGSPLQEAAQGVEEPNRMGAVFAAAAMCCTLMTRTWYRHYDGQAHRMNPQVYIIGDPACGKSFADVLDRNIMAAMRHADQPARDAEERYKREQKARTTSSKAQKGEALQQPDGCIRYLPSRTSNAIFYRRAINAKEAVGGELMPLHLYTFDSELDSSITAQSGGSWIGKHDLELKAFHNEMSGVDYANQDSVNQLIPIYYNQVVTGTPVSLAKKITLRNINDGLCSRIAVFRMASSQFEMVERRSQNANYVREETLKSWGYYFDSLKGELKIERLVDHVYGLCEQSAMEAKMSGDLVLDYLRKRAVFYATWFTVPQIVARVRQPGKTLDDIEVTDDDLRVATVIYDAVLYYQDRMFGQMLLDSWDNARREFQPRRRNSRYAEAYMQLPRTFTVSDVERVMGLNRNAAYKHASRWADSGYVERRAKGRFAKIISDIRPY